MASRPVNTPMSPVAPSPARHSMSGSQNSAAASRPPRSSASQDRRTTSTFSSDIVPPVSRYPALRATLPHSCVVARSVLILGSTGSIGTQALEIVERSDDLVVAGLSADRSWEALVAQARAHGVTRVALGDPEAAAQAARAWPDGEVLAGAEGLVRLVVESGAELVLNALVGAAGLGPTGGALGEGGDLALGNKEALVGGGE